MTDYYTPEPEEFCINFSFEESWSTEGKGWKKHTIKDAADLADWMDTIAFDSTSTMFRAHYLNLKDLESIGFINTPGNSGHFIKCTKDYPDHTLTIVQSPVSSNSFNILSNSKEFNFLTQSYFTGEIKNKSVLSKVLKFIEKEEQNPLYVWQSLKH